MAWETSLESRPVEVLWDSHINSRNSLVAVITLKAKASKAWLSTDETHYEISSQTNLMSWEMTPGPRSPPADSPSLSQYSH